MAKASKVNAGDIATKDQYNNLVDDAFGGSQLLAHQQTTPNMTLKVEKGIAYIGSTQVNFAGGNSPTFTAPTTNPRIDLLVIDSSGVLSIVQGTEAATPSPPTYPVDKIPICEVYLSVGTTAIYDTDHGTNGYIKKDTRPFFERGNVENYQDVIASRAIDTTYQNTTGKWIMVISSISLSAGMDQSVDAIAYIGTTSPNSVVSKVGIYHNVDRGYSGSGTVAVKGNVTFLVPPSWYYRIGKSGTGGASIDTWWEAELNL